MGFCFTTFAQGSYVEEALTDIFTWFNPIVHNAYCQYPIKGSGKLVIILLKKGNLKVILIHIRPRVITYIFTI